MPIRFPLSARTAALGVVLIAVQPAISQSERPAPTPSTAPGPDNAPSSDAARHVRRTACLKDARAKKLVGAQRDAYVKSCVTTPPKA